MSMSAEQVDRKAVLKNALAAIDELQARLDATERARTEPIAIIGLSCRFPAGANDPEAYWQLLREGRDAVRSIPPERWKLIGADTELIDATTPWYGGFLDQIDQFDPQFFGIAPREAATMDPQQRLALEVSWEALERAGQAPDKLNGSATGVFLGITTNDYSQLAKAGGPDQLDVYVATGSALNAAAGRVAYTLGLQGPCMAIDTACSSSLVAVHLACQSLRSGESHLALAGGVNAILAPEPFICFGKWGMMAPDGRCKTFDAGADGFVRGEGCGILVLKRLSEAQVAGDPILAVIRGSAVNQDGRSSGLTVPNGPAQQAVIRKALASAGIKPGAVGYLETHGTGTSLGDPIEVEAIGAVLGQGRAQPLTIGSVKTNLGHLESAAGIAGLIKVVLSMQHEEIPPHLHLRERSPRIPWPDFPIVIPTEPTAWKRGNGRRIAGVSAFGFSGTNAHVVLEEAPLDPHPQPLSLTGRGAGVRVEDRPLHILSLSAKNENALRELATRYASQLPDQPTSQLADYCFTANTGRAHFAHRAAIVAGSFEQLREKLAGLSAGEAPKARPKIAFLFTGQGAQYIGMGRLLYDTQPTFRKIINQCDERLRPHLGESILSVIYPASNAQQPTSRIDKTAYTQPALFAIEYALAEVWRSWGIEPSAVMGHSVGEYVAACLAGVFSPEDGLKLIAERARLMQALPQDGEMAAVFADEAGVAAAIAPHADKVSVAAINGPDNVVISGARSSVQAALRQLEAQGVKARGLTVSHAFHSPLMEPMLDAFEKVAATVTYAPPRIGLISNVTGKIAEGPEAVTAAYWRHHARQPVRFADSVKTLHEMGYDAMLEIGPSPTLLSMAQRCLPDASAAWLPSLRKGQDDWKTMLDSLGALYVRGADVNWIGLDRDYARWRVPLPTYPFQRQRYWLVPKVGGSRVTAGKHPLVGDHLNPAHTPDIHIWESEINTTLFPYLDDHRVQNVPVVPATAYLEMVMAAAAEAFGAKSFALSEINYQKPIILPEGASPMVQVVLAKTGDRRVSFQVFSRLSDSAAWTLHVTGQLHHDAQARAPQRLEQSEIEAIRGRCAEEVPGDRFYRRLSDKGNQWGPAFQGLQQVWRGEREALSLVRVPPSLEAEFERYVFHPAVADACGHVLTATISLDKSGADKGGAFVGGGIGEVRVYARPRGKQFWTYARLRPEAEQESNVLVGDVQVIDESGTLVSETIGARLWYLDRNAQRALLDAERVEDWFYEVRWETAARSAPIAATRGTWLIFTDRQGIGDEVAKTLTARGERTICIATGAAYDCASDSCYTVRPDQPDDMRRLMQDAIGAERACRGIIHLWSLDAPAPGDAAALDAAQTLNSVSALHAIQAAARIEWRDFPRVWLVTRSAQPVTKAQPIAVTQTPAWGLGRTLALEHSELWGGLIDLDPDAVAGEAAIHLSDEVMNRSREDQIAFRSGQRYVARLAARGRAATAAPIRWREDAGYLITGGLGGLGLQVARWMAEQGARHIVLMGRTPLPPRAEWDRVEAGGRLAQQIAAIRDIEALGAKVQLAAVDVADEAQLQSFLDAYRHAGHPAIRGIAHAAGILKHHALVDCDAAELKDVMRAKVAGGWLLHRLLGDALDFFVMFSSASSLLSSPRLGSYAAGNAFLDGLAHYRQVRGLPALSVNWGVWSDAGMAAQFDVDDVGLIALRGMGTISTKQGLNALGRLMQQDAAQVGVLPVNWKRWQELYPAFVDAPFLAHVVRRAEKVVEAKTPGLTRQALIAAGDRQATLQAYLAALVSKTMGVAELDPRQPLSELGLDSLMAVEMKNRIEAELAIVVPMVKFLQGPSVAQLTAQVLEQLEMVASAEVKRPDRDDERTQTERLLANLDQLPDDQVDSLLNELLSAEGHANE